MYMQSFLYENMTKIHPTNLMQVPCECKMQTMHNYAKRKMFLYFELNEIKRKKMTLPPSDFATIHI